VSFFYRVIGNNNSQEKVGRWRTINT